MIIGHGSKDPNAQRSLDYIVNELKDSYRNVSRCMARNRTTRYF